jgi:hypothetical protein
MLKLYQTSTNSVQYFNSQKKKKFSNQHYSNLKFYFNTYRTELWLIIDDLV